MSTRNVNQAREERVHVFLGPSKERAIMIDVDAERRNSAVAWNVMVATQKSCQHMSPITLVPQREPAHHSGAQEIAERMLAVRIV